MNHILLVAIVTLLAALPFRAVAQPGNAANGERLYRACAPCHSLEPDRNMTGPSLAELWNRKSGGLPSFPRYSPAIKSAGIIWNDDTLNEWIRDPQHFIPGNTMTFPGIKEPRQRADLLAYLKDANQPGHAPKAAQGGGQMGGMMMGGGQVPNLKVLGPEDGYNRSTIAATATRSPRPTERFAIFGSGTCGSKPMSARTARRKARPLLSGRG